MGRDYFLDVKPPDGDARTAALSLVLPRGSSTGPFLASYARHHLDSPGAPDQYVLTGSQWDGFMEELYAQESLIRALANCVVSVFDFDPDVPDEIREPQPADWQKLARFEQWVIRVFGHSADGSPEPVFSLETEHFRRGVIWAWDLSYWLELDPEIRAALRDTQNLIFLVIG